VTRAGRQRAAARRPRRGPGEHGPAGDLHGGLAASASPSVADVRAYVLTGGRVTLDVTQSSVQLVTAVPDAAYSVQTWSGTDWLRVDFSSEPKCHPW